MAEEAYAVIVVTIGPLPAGTKWDQAGVGGVYQKISAAAEEESLLPAGTTGRAAGEVLTVHELGETSEETLTRLGHYLSTYCLHGNHEQCRLFCKKCRAPCKCGCHV